MVEGGMERREKAMDAQYILIVFYNYSYINHKVSIKLLIKTSKEASFIFYSFVFFLIHFNITSKFFLFLFIFFNLCFF